MTERITRRGFLQRGVMTAAACATTRLRRVSAGSSIEPAEVGFPLVDLHAHLDKSTIDDVVALGLRRHVKFGIVEHAGTKENKYPIVLSNDAELRGYLKMLDGKPVYKGIQAEWTDWMSCFSREALAGLDFVLTDAWTFPGKDGRRMKLWEKDADLGDLRTFMDRYVDWHIRIMETEPIDIMANLTWLPAPLAGDYDRLWTETRMRRIIDTAVKRRIALEISASLRLPKAPFLKMAKAAGARFTFGSNGRYPNMGKLDYAVQVAGELGLTRSNLFIPSPGLRRRYNDRG
jgi:histidinol phosphatase-like PHP family hydrolase